MNWKTAVLLFMLLAVLTEALSCEAPTADKQASPGKATRLQILFPDIADVRRPCFVDLYGSAAEALVRRQWELALSRARQVLSDTPRAPNEEAFAHLVMGLALLGKNELAAADAELDKVLKSPVAHDYRAGYQATGLLFSGKVRLANGDYAGAADRLVTLLREHPALMASRRALKPAINALSKSGRSAELPDLLNFVVDKTSGTKTALLALVHLGRLYEKEGEPELARETYEKLVSEFPDSPIVKAVQKRIESLGKE